MCREKKGIKDQRGFTLIEIIAVLIILGILAAVAIPKYFDLQDDAAKSSLRQAVSELVARDNLLWSKYKTGGKVNGAVVTLDNLNKGTYVISADLTFGDFYLVAWPTDGAGEATIKSTRFDAYGVLSRVAATASQPGQWDTVRAVYNRGDGTVIE